MSVFSKHKSTVILAATVVALAVIVAIIGFFACSSKPSSLSTIETEFDDEVNDAQQDFEQPVTDAGANPASQTESVATNAEAHSIDSFEPLSQYPELSTGCEITSLAATLNYYSLPADKCDLADNYLNKGAVGSTDPRVAFVGNPRSSDSYGCYAPVIVQSANSYLGSLGSKLQARDISGTEFSDLLAYVDKDTPVIVWGTRYCEQGHYSVTWNWGSGSFTWFTPEHCMVLVGYDLPNDLVYVADPLEGSIMSYSLELFESRYADLKKQAVVIE